MHHQPDGYEAWERRYLYANMPESGAAVRSNRLLATSNPGDVEGVYSARYGYADGTDASDPTNNAGLHGSMTAMPHLPSIHWDYADRMQSCTKTVGPNPDRVYFTYDASGQRVRKVYEHSSTREERIYLGGYEVYRSWSTGANASLDVHRTTLHVMDDQRRVAMVENTLADPEVATGRRWRFQLDNHLGTATLELDHEGNVISYEEYHPYGTSAVKVQRSGTGFSQKRYRYTGKERDEETGLYYHEARYYAPWLGRWTAADPLGVADGVNVLAYAHGDPMRASDPSGTQTAPSGDAYEMLTPEQVEGFYGVIEEGVPADRAGLPSQVENDLGAFAGNATELPVDKITPSKRAAKKSREAASPTKPAEAKPEVGLGPEAPLSESHGHIGPGGTRAASNNLSSEANSSDSTGDKAAAFGSAALEGAAGAVIGGAITSLAIGAFCGPAAPICTGVAMGGLLLAGVASFVMSGAAQQVVESGKNIAQGNGTAQDWGVAGGVTGTLLGGLLVGKLGGAPAEEGPRAYSVAFETQLAESQLGLSRPRHFAIANEALGEARSVIPELAELVPPPAGRASAPDGWVWQHATIDQGAGRAGVLQLVPKSQHTAGSPFWRLLHPLPNGGGGYSQWAIPAGAPRN
jgi:RHS repeat-associated protein